MSLNGIKLSELPKTNNALLTDTVAALRAGVNVMIPVASLKGGATENHTHVKADITDLGDVVTIGIIEW